MALKIEWGDESHRYIYTKFYPSWSWQDFRANRPLYEEMVTSVRHRVDYVADLSDIASLPTNMIANSARVFDMRLENEGYAILVGAGQIIQLTYNMIEAILPIVKNYVIFVDCMDDALEIIARDRHDEEIRH